MKQLLNTGSKSAEMKMMLSTAITLGSVTYCFSKRDNLASIHKAIKAVFDGQITWIKSKNENFNRCEQHHEDGVEGLPVM